MTDRRPTGVDAYSSRLRAGETIVFGEGGNSMVPLIRSREKCTYVPVVSEECVQVGDAVFCRVGGAFMTHLCTAKEPVGGGRHRYQISNNHNFINGWTTLEHVYGRVTDVGGRKWRGRRRPAPPPATTLAAGCSSSGTSEASVRH
jgi:hypothetical protein